MRQEAGKGTSDLLHNSPIWLRTWDKRFGSDKTKGWTGDGGLAWPLGRFPAVTSGGSIWGWAGGVGEGMSIGVLASLISLREQRLCKVTQPDPPTLTWYCWFGSFSTTWPTLSQRLLRGFWIATWLPTLTLGNERTERLYRSTKAALRSAKASSLFYAALTQSACGL